MSDQEPKPVHQPPIRIAFCITELDPGGAEWALYHLVSRLDRGQWQPQVYCLGPRGEVAERIESLGIPVICFGATNRQRLDVFFWLARELRKFRPQIVQGYLFHGNIVSRLSGWMAGVPLRISGHRVAEKEKRWHLWMDRFTSLFATDHVCVSRGVLNHVSQYIKLTDQNSTVITNGIVPLENQAGNTDSDEPALPSWTGKTVLGIGRLSRQKGFPFLIRAFADLGAQFDDTRLVIVGDGEEKDALQSLVRELQLDDRVLMTGFRSDVPKLMAEADIFVLSSLWEGMPNVVLQAMQAGLPVIATQVEGISELLEDRRSGRVVKPGSAKELREAIQEMLAQPDVALRLTENAQDVVFKSFTWESVVAQYDQFYRDRLSRL